MFINASNLSISDATKQAEYRAAQMRILDERKRVLRDNLDSLRHILNKEISGKDLSPSGLGQKARELMGKINSYESELASINKDLLEAIQGTTKEVDSKSFVTPQFINTAITRFFVVALLAFFVQLLASQYRYMLRMSSHLDSIADAVELLGSEIDQGRLAETIKAVSPAGIDFSGKSGLELSMVRDALKLVGQKNG